MLYFASDYLEGAHPKLLERLIETNMEKTSGYGTDEYTESARAKIRQAMSCPEADIYFLAGGTQTNQLAVSTLLEDFEGVVAATTGHVSLHEAGAIEFSGHKVLTLEGKAGKLSADSVRALVQGFYDDENHEHMVYPGMVYISQPTEYGTLYTKAELKSLREVCDEFGMRLYADGARLGYGLMSEGCDVTLCDMAELCHAFYIGGTKVGALFGEALVFPKGNTPRCFLTRIKQHGALLAKGRVAGVMFDTLFSDNLYFEISSHAVKLAERLREGLRQKGYGFYVENTTNQIFVTLNREQMERLEKSVTFSFWEWLEDGRAVIRLATSWATDPHDVEELIKIL